MFTTNTMLRRPVRKFAVVAATMAALAGGGLAGAQAATAGAEKTTAVVRADKPKGDLNGGKVAAAKKAGNQARPAPSPGIERAETPRGDLNDGKIVAPQAPGVDHRPAPPPADD